MSSNLQPTMNSAHLIDLSCNHTRSIILAGGTLMSRKYFFVTLLAIAFLALSAVTASAQTGQLRGHVKLKQADGTTVPAVGAAIDVFRTDISGEYHVKTDKKGEFVFAGIPYTGDYIIAVSLAGATPSYQGGVKAGRDVDYELEMSPGDGRRLTLDDVKKLGSSGSSGGGSKSSGESAADKAKREELMKKNAEIEEKNKKRAEINEV